jgi:hypothetical protein
MTRSALPAYLRSRVDSGAAVARFDNLGFLHCDADRKDSGLYCEETSEGFLKCDARITRTGNFRYGDDAGNTWGELRTDDEVFDPESMASFGLLVLTNDHPTEMVSTSNVRDVQVGSTGTDVRRDGIYLRVTIIITDSATIAAIRAGKVQLSCGYYVEHIIEAGIDEFGQPYAARQTKIRGNHLALVDEGRAGPACRLLLDAGAAVSQPNTPSQPGALTMPTKKSTKDAAIIIGGESHEVPDAVAALIAELKAEKAELEAKLAEPKPEPAPEPAPAPAEPAPAAQAPAAAADSAELHELRGEVAALTTALARHTDGAHVDARIALCRDASRILGDGFVTDGKDTLQLQRAVVAHVLPELSTVTATADAMTLGGMYKAALVADRASRDSSGELLYLTAPRPSASNADSNGIDLNQAHADALARITKR